MKKWSFVLGVVISCMFLAVSVQADVIFEPEDSFYQDHVSDCEYVNRQFTANGPDGKVIVYKSPESPEVVDTWENGRQATISHTYQDKDGVLWGVSESSGWMPMEYMEVVYDNISFMEEHAAEVKEQSGTLEGQKDEKFYFWKYPSSEVSYEASIVEEPPSYGQVYTDSQGRQWGYVEYYYGDRDVWVCIDQPTADYGQLYPQGAPKENAQEGEENEPPRASSLEGGSQEAEGQQAALQEEEGRIQPKRNNGLIGLAAALVGVVVLVTVVLLVVLKKKGR